MKLTKKVFKCQECGKKLSASARKCSKCGSEDIDVMAESFGIPKLSTLLEMKDYTVRKDPHYEGKYALFLRAGNKKLHYVSGNFSSRVDAWKQAEKTHTNESVYSRAKARRDAARKAADTDVRKNQSDLDSRTVDLRKSGAQKKSVKDGTLYLKNKTLQVWWKQDAIGRPLKGTLGRETWNFPDVQQAKEAFDQWEERRGK